MMNQPMTDGPLDRASFVKGTTVFDVAHEKVGTVSAQDPQVGCLVIQKGWLFVHEFYVPFSLVVSQDERGIFLTVSKEELKANRWKVPPPDAENAAATLVGMENAKRGVDIPVPTTAGPLVESSFSEPALLVPPVVSVVGEDGQEDVSSQIPHG